MNEACSSHPHPQRQFVVLPENFDQWFATNNFIRGPICWIGDAPSEKVVCTLQLNRVVVWQFIALYFMQLIFLSYRPTKPTITSRTA